MIKAGQSKFDSWSLASVKRLMGVPLDHIGKPSTLEQVKHELKDLPGRKKYL